MKKEGQNNTVDQTFSLGSQAWNVADGYTKIKILRHLILLDRYENIAIYGSEDIEEFILEEQLIAQRRTEALSRFLTTLKQLLGNVKFALKKEDRPEITIFLKKISEVEEVIDGVKTVETNMITHETVITIEEKHFKKCLSILQRIKDEINFPINNANLIFRGSDEIDLDKIMTEITEGG